MGQLVQYRKMGDSYDPLRSRIPGNREIDNLNKARGDN